MGGCLPRGLQGLQRPCKAPCWPGWSSGARCASWWPPGSGGASSGGAAAPVLSTALWEATGCRVSDYLAAPWEFQKETSGRSVLMRPDVLSTCGRWGYVDVAARMTHGCRFLTAGQLARASELAPQVGRNGFLLRNALSSLRSEKGGGRCGVAHLFGLPPYLCPVTSPALSGPADVRRRCFFTLGLFFLCDATDG